MMDTTLHTMALQPQPTSDDAVATLVDMARGYPVSRCLHVVADLGVAGALDDAPLTAGELATAVHVQPDSVGRVLRLLSAYGVFTTRDDTFLHTPASRLLRTDHPRSLRALVRLHGQQPAWDSFGRLLYSVRTARPAAEQVTPGGMWGYFARDSDARATFDAAMSAKARGQIVGVVAAYDFSQFGTVGDIGGGRGHLLQAVLEAAPASRGVLFDLPVIREAGGLGSARLTPHAGDFFKDALPACDAYLLMEVIHDWADAEAVSILKAVHQAAHSDARLLLIEQLIPETPGPYWAKTLDLYMLALLGGRQRSCQEYADLLKRAGFTLRRVIDTSADVSIVEATPTWNSFVGLVPDYNRGPAKHVRTAALDPVAIRAREKNLDLA
jgi:hypothetical protein